MCSTRCSDGRRTNSNRNNLSVVHRYRIRIARCPRYGVGCVRRSQRCGQRIRCSDFRQRIRVFIQRNRSTRDFICKRYRVEFVRKEVYALVIEKDTFDTYTLQKVEKNNLTMSREEAIQTVAASLGEKDCIVSTTGMTSRELFEYRTQKNQGHERDFLTVGSMGHASQIALGIAMEKSDRRIWCFDGDGATIMHMGSMAIVASKQPQNYVHVVFNNGAHDSVGGQPTVGLNIDLPRIARAVGYPHTFSVSTKEDLQDILTEIAKSEGLTFLEVKVKKGNRKDLGRPTTTPIENKEALMDFLSK